MKRYLSIVMLLAVALVADAQSKIIAHRGYWDTEGSAQNSHASLTKAAEIGCWGSEFDVWITRDGVCVVNHDATIDGKRIEDVDYAEIRDCRLKNGERLPVLEEYLWWGSHYAPMKLILEIKVHSSQEANVRCTDEVLRLVKKYGVVDNVEYISFSMDVCEYLVQNGAKMLDGPNGQRSGKRVDKADMKVSYLNGDKSPAEVKAAGLTGIDYEKSVLLTTHPEWIEQAHALGLTVNVWTVDNPEEMRTLQQNGVDMITTNKPLVRF